MSKAQITRAENEGDGLDGCRGIMWGLVLGTVFWIAILIVWWPK